MLKRKNLENGDENPSPQKRLKTDISTSSSIEHKDMGNEHEEQKQMEKNGDEDKQENESDESEGDEGDENGEEDSNENEEQKQAGKNGDEGEDKQENESDDNESDEGDEEDSVDIDRLEIRSLLDPSIEFDYIPHKISELLEKYSEIKSNNNFSMIQELMEKFPTEIDQSLLDNSLNKAVESGDSDAAKFLVDEGADVDEGIKTAIIKDSKEILESLEAEALEDYITLAIENDSYDSLDYFLSRDFSTSSTIILTAAAALSDSDHKKAGTLVEAVCELADLEDVYDLIQYIIKEDAEKLISVFTKHFDSEELLDEILENDGENDLFHLVFQHIKAQCPEAELLELSTIFKEKLTISDSILIFPREKFSGDPDLKNIRETYSKSILHPEARAAMNFLGVTLSTANRYFSKSPFHIPTMEDSERYFRSTKHPISHALKRAAIESEFDESLPEAETKKGPGDLAHLGGINHPHDSLNNYTKMTPMHSAEKKSYQPKSGQLYDDLLHYRHRICNYIHSKVAHEDKNALKIGFYHNYPCIMVLVETPTHASLPTPTTLNAYANIIISYFIPLVNYTAQKHGLDIELVRRSSFGFLTPTIADCGQSLRINVGIVPIEYANVLIGCLNQLDVILMALNSKSTVGKLDASLPDDCFLKDSGYKKYMASGRKKREAPKVTNLIELLWAQVDKGGCSTAKNLTRKAFARNGLSAEAYDAIQKSNPKNAEQYAQIFLRMLRWGVGRLHLSKKKTKLEFKCEKNKKFSLKSSLKSNVKVIDKEFFKIIDRLIAPPKSELQLHSTYGLIKDNLDATLKKIDRCIAEKSLHNLYFYLEKLNELTYSDSILTYSGTEEDDCGSDSEVEEEDKESRKNLYGKKVIVQNGMRAILAALHAGAHHLFPDYLTGSEYYPLFLHGTYYETASAMKLLAKFDHIKELSQISNTEILIYDINACVKNSIAFSELSNEQLSKIKVLIIDSTSATIKQHHSWIHKFKQQPKMEVLMFVSSGFKNEQMGADKSPYGTIRVFAKNKTLLEKIIQFIKKKEKKTALKSGIAHHYRRMHKRMGNTPRNRAILDYIDGQEHKSGVSSPSSQPSSSFGVSSGAGSSSSSGLFGSSKASASTSAGSKSLQTSSSTENRNGKDVSKIYWYEDSEINRILDISVRQHVNRTQNGQFIHILAPLDNISRYGLIQTLAAHNRKQGIVLIPFNLGRLHWVGLTLEYDAAGRLISANYYDPQRNNVPPSLNYLLKTMSRSGDHVQEFTPVQNEQLIRQTNGSDCGPCTIENLLAAAGHRESKETDPVGRRLRHLQLLEADDSNFYQPFYQRQRLNQSSFSKLSSSGIADRINKSKNSNQLGILEYKGLLSLGLEILNLPNKSLQKNLIAALKPSEEKEKDEHASQLDRIRTTLNDDLNDKAARPIIESFFCLNKESKSLAAAPLRIDFNQLLPLFMILSSSKNQIEVELKDFEKLFSNESKPIYTSPLKSLGKESKSSSSMVSR